MKHKRFKKSSMNYIIRDKNEKEDGTWRAFSLSSSQVGCLITADMLSTLVNTSCEDKVKKKKAPMSWLNKCKMNNWISALAAPWDLPTNNYNLNSITFWSEVITMIISNYIVHVISICLLTTKIKTKTSTSKYPHPKISNNLSTLPIYQTQPLKSWQVVYGTVHQYS